MTPASARGCSDWMNRARRPASARTGSPWTFQVTDDGPKSPRSATPSRLPAVRADAPVRHLGLVDDEAGGFDRLQARGGADGTVDVGDVAAPAAHQVVVVVAGPRLVAGRCAGRRDPAGQPGGG